MRSRYTGPHRKDFPPWSPAQLLFSSGSSRPCFSRPFFSPPDRAHALGDFDVSSPRPRTRDLARCGLRSAALRPPGSRFCRLDRPGYRPDGPDQHDLTVRGNGFTIAAVLPPEHLPLGEAASFCPAGRHFQRSFGERFSLAAELSETKAAHGPVRSGKSRARRAMQFGRRDLKSKGPRPVFRRVRGPSGPPASHGRLQMASSGRSGQECGNLTDGCTERRRPRTVDGLLPVHSAPTSRGPQSAPTGALFLCRALTARPQQKPGSGPGKVDRRCTRDAGMDAPIRRSTRDPVRYSLLR
jgi:hypothetical protein